MLQMEQENFGVFERSCEKCCYREYLYDYNFRIADKIADLMIKKTTKINFVPQYSESITIDYMMLDTAGRIITGLMVKGYYGAKLFAVKMGLKHNNYLIEKYSDDC